MTATQEDLYYLGGLIDGEAGVWIGVGKSKTCRLGYRVAPEFQMGMKEMESNEKIKDTLQTLCYEIEVNYTFRDVDDGYAWHFEIHSKRDVLAFLHVMKDYVRAKRDTFETILSIDWDARAMTEERFIKIMETRDELRSESNRKSKYDAEYFKEEFN